MSRQAKFKIASQFPFIDPRTLPFFSSFIAVSFIIVVELAFFRPYFLVNDDDWLLFIAKGVGIALAPDEHLFLSNFLLGYLLKTLYTIYPQVCWYTGFQMLAHFLSLWAFLSASLLRSRRFFTVFLFLIGSLFIDLYYSIQSSSYTILAALVFQGGLFLLMGLGDDRNRLYRNKIIFLGGACLFLSSVIRLKVFLFSAFLTAPFFLFELQKVKNKTKILGPVLGIALLVGLCALADYKHYQEDKGWRGFRQFHGAAVKYLDCRNMEYTPKSRGFFDAVGWSQNDLDLFKNWYFLDKETYGPEELEKLGRNFSYTWYGKPGGYSSLRQIFSLELTQNIVLCLFFFSLFASRLNFAFLFLNATWILGIVIGLMYFAKAPERLFWPAFSFEVALAIYYAIPPVKTAPSNENPLFDRIQRKGYLFLGILTLLLIPTLYKFYSRNLFMKSCENTFKTDLCVLNPKEDQLYVVWDSSYPYELVNTLDDFELYRKFHIFALAPFQTSPIGKKMLEHFGVKNLFLEMVDNPNIFLICSPSEGAMYYRYMEEKHHMKIYAEKSFECPFFKVFRIHSRPPAYWKKTKPEGLAKQVSSPVRGNPPI